MLWHQYPEELDSKPLQHAYESLKGDPDSAIPWLVWLLENPNSLVALPGKIDLYRHDCLHLLLKQGFTSSSEAYVVGFTMGNDSRTSHTHLLIFKIAARWLYPKKYQISREDFILFERGFELGQKTRIKNLNQISFDRWLDKKLPEIREEIGLTCLV